MRFLDVTTPATVLAFAEATEAFRGVHYDALHVLLPDSDEPTTPQRVSVARGQVTISKDLLAPGTNVLLRLRTSGKRVKNVDHTPNLAGRVQAISAAR